MSKNYHSDQNPICPYTKQHCDRQDLDGYTNCQQCANYGNGVRATGAMTLADDIQKCFSAFNKTRLIEAVKWTTFAAIIITSIILIIYAIIK